MKTREEVVQSIIARFSSEVGNVWNSGYRQGGKDALERVSKADEEECRKEKEIAYNEGWNMGYRACKNELKPVTNGDKLREIFGDDVKRIRICGDMDEAVAWLEAPYKEPGHE